MTPAESRSLEQLQSRSLEMEARIMAIARMLCSHLARGDAELTGRIFQQLEASKRQIHATLLLKLENKSPGDAAKLDKRPERDVE